MRMSGRAWRSGPTSSRPLPSPNLRSRTAKAGGRAVWASASATEPTDVTMKPRSSRARAMRVLGLGPVGGPAGGVADLAVGEGYGILHDVSDTLHDLRAAHLYGRSARHAFADRPG